MVTLFGVVAGSIQGMVFASGRVRRRLLLVGWPRNRGWRRRLFDVKRRRSRRSVAELEWVVCDLEMRRESEWVARFGGLSIGASMGSSARNLIRRTEHPGASRWSLRWKYVA